MSQVVALWTDVIVAIGVSAVVAFRSVMVTTAVTTTVTTRLTRSGTIVTGRTIAMTDTQTKDATWDE